MSFWKAATASLEQPITTGDMNLPGRARDHSLLQDRPAQLQARRRHAHQTTAGVRRPRLALAEVAAGLWTAMWADTSKPCASLVDESQGGCQISAAISSGRTRSRCGRKCNAAAHSWPCGGSIGLSFGGWRPWSTAEPVALAHLAAMMASMHLGRSLQACRRSRTPQKQATTTTLWTDLGIWAMF